MFFQCGSRIPARTPAFPLAEPAVPRARVQPRERTKGTPQALPVLLQRRSRPPAMRPRRLLRVCGTWRDELPKIPVRRILGDSGVCSPRAMLAALNPLNRHGGAASTSAPLNPLKIPQIGKSQAGNLCWALCLSGEAKTARGGAEISQWGCCFRSSTHGGAKKPLWGRAGAAESGLRLEIVSEVQKQPKIPAGGGGGFWHRGGLVAVDRGLFGQKEGMPRGVPAGF